MLLRVCFVILVSGLLLACAGGGVKESGGRIYWPKPPDPPRFVYEASLRSGDSVKPVSASDQMRASITGYVQKKDVFMKPFGVAARKGSVVVTDTVRRLGFIFNLPRQKLFKFGNVGKEGVLVKPMGVELDNAQNIYVADVGARRVYVYDEVGMYLRSIGSPEDLDRPIDVAVTADGARIYVLDAGGIDSQRHRLVAYDKNGERLFVTGRRGTGNGEFNLPAGVALAPDGTIYVLDSGNFRVQVFSPEGQFLRSWGKVGRNFGDLARPRGVAVDSEGNVYITDTAYRNFQIFTPRGELLMAVGGEGMTDEPGQFALPAGIAVDGEGYVYVVDQLFMKVDVIRRLAPQEVEKIMVNEAAYHP